MKTKEDIFTTGLREAEGTLTANSLSSSSISKGSNISDQKGCSNQSVMKTNISMSEQENEIQIFQTKKNKRLLKLSQPPLVRVCPSCTHIIKMAAMNNVA